MGNLGLVAFNTDKQQPFLGYELSQGCEYSEATAAQIDQEIQRQVEDRHTAVRELLTAARAQLDLLAETLLREETADQDALARILGARPEPIAGETDEQQ